MSESSDRRRKRFMQTSPNLQVAQDIAEASRDLEAGVHERLAYDELRPDPDNPHWTGRDAVTVALMKDYLANPGSYENHQHLSELEYISQLVESIRQHGMGQAITAWRNGSLCQIIDGERRWIALGVLQRQVVDVRVYYDRPDVAVLQHQANHLRSQPSFRESFYSIRKVLKEHEEMGDPVTNAQRLEELLQYKRSTAFRWWRFLNAPADVIEAIEAGQVSDYRFADELCSLKTKKERLARLGVLDASTKPVKVTPRKKDSKTISLGKTMHPEVVREIIELVAPELVKEINWKDKASVQKGFSVFVRHMERKVLESK